MLVLARMGWDIEGVRIIELEVRLYTGRFKSDLDDD